MNHELTIYAYVSLEAVLAGEKAGGAKAALPGLAESCDGEAGMSVSIHRGSVTMRTNLRVQV